MYLESRLVPEAKGKFTRPELSDWFTMVAPAGRLKRNPYFVFRYALPPVVVAVAVGVAEGPVVPVGVGVADGPVVPVGVGVAEGPLVPVAVGVGDGPAVPVGVGVDVTPVPVGR